MWQFSCCGNLISGEDWSSDGEEMIIENTLRRDFLLVKLQEIEDSTTSLGAENAITAIDGAVSADETKLLRFLAQAGTQSIIYEALNREKGRPSRLVAASLLCKFAKHSIGFRQTIYGPVVDTQARSPKLVSVQSWGYA